MSTARLVPALGHSAYSVLAVLWRLACSVLGVLGAWPLWYPARSASLYAPLLRCRFCAWPLGVLGAGPVPVLDVPSAWRTWWSTGSALRCYLRCYAAPSTDPCGDRLLSQTASAMLSCNVWSLRCSAALALGLCGDWPLHYCSYLWCLSTL